MSKNVLYYGDNLEVLQRHIEDESVDLVYLDPPFNSNRDYNVLFEERDGSKSKAQIRVFEDTWRWDQGSASAYAEIVESGPEKVSKAMQAFGIFPGESDMLAYLAMMAPRLVELRRVLKQTGSIYLHCDPTASHYLKMLMDAVFGARCFRNEIAWCYKSGGASKHHFAKKHDLIFRYTKTDNFIFNYEKEKSYGKTGGGQGGKVKYYSDGIGTYSFAGIKDWWIISMLSTTDSERLGYPTQKPETLLERIIKASSNKGDTILDPFCGCGTTIAVAERLERQWIGIDTTHLAIALIKHRLQEAFSNRAAYKVVGEPIDLAGAEALAEQDPYQFQWWAVSKVYGRPVEQRKGADKGIDGKIYFHEDPEKPTKTKQIVLQVKAGRIGPAYVRDLVGVIEREKAAIGVLITMQTPTKAMRSEAASAGFYNSDYTGGGHQKKYPRLQLLTIEELFAGKGIDCPPLRQTDVTFKKAPKHFKGKKPEQQELL